MVQFTIILWGCNIFDVKNLEIVNETFSHYLHLHELKQVFSPAQSFILLDLMRSPFKAFSDNNIILSQKGFHSPPTENERKKKL